MRPRESSPRSIPKRVTPAANGAYIFDMGQNMVGWVDS